MFQTIQPRYPLVLFLILLTDINDLQDVVVSSQLEGANVDLHIVGQEVLRQSLNLLRPGGTPHQSLTIRLEQKGIFP